MALIADKVTSKKLENRLDEFSKFGMTLYYLFEEGRINISDLENLFFSHDDEKSSFIYSKLIRHVNPKDIKMSFDKYSIENPNTSYLAKDIYQNNLNILYTRKLINTILSDSKDNIDKVYVNTYDYLLKNSNYNKP